MDVAECFSACFGEAREKFRAAASDAGAALESVSNPRTGPGGELLSTDVAWLGPRDAANVLVMISGTHGAEGFCGSGVQTAWLGRGEAHRMNTDTAVLLIHAINPYGFAWLRRVTEENVDLNRNWVDFAAPRPRNVGYDELRDAICPTEWNEATHTATRERFFAFVAEHGEAALHQAIAGGQYTDPLGVWYGGSEPTWARRTQSAIFEAYLSGARRVAILDFHTGLGPWGYGEQIVVEPPPSAAFQRARAAFGAAVVSTTDGSSSSSDISGSGLAAAAALLPRADVTGLALEFGTLPGADVTDAVRADAWLHAYGDPLSPRGDAIRAQVRAAFYGDTDAWKGMVVGQALVACRQAFAGLLE
jgi:hypothetical protein